MNKFPKTSLVSNNPVFKHKTAPYTEGKKDKCCEPHELGSPPHRTKCFRVTSPSCRALGETESKLAPP